MKNKSMKCCTVMMLENELKNYNKNKKNFFCFYYVFIMYIFRDYFVTFLDFYYIFTTFKKMEEGTNTV